jgi:predicted ATP-grasp superfamily ATP-dependent carboligase
VSLSNVIVLEPYNGGLALARSLVRAGHPVTMVVGEELSYMARTRGAAGRVLAAGQGQDAIRPALAELAEQGPAVVVTGADTATEWLARHRAELPDGLRTFEGPGSGHLELIGKERAYEIAAAAGVAVPWMRPVQTVDELADAARDATYPCVLKPVLSHVFRQQFGEERVFLVNDAEEARRSGTPALEAGIEMLMSEYVPGGDGDVEEAIVVRTAEGEYPVRFGCRKIRQHPTGFGAASICVSDPIDDSMALATAVLDEAGFTGVVGVETKRHAETGRVYFIEANVRLPTQWGLGDASGVEASRRLAATLAGERLGPQPPLKAGVKLVFPELEVPAALALLRRENGRGRTATAREILRSYRGTRELGILNPRDPAPLVNRARRVLARRLGRA